MNKISSRWYTTAKALRLICGSLIVLGVNLIYQEISWQRLGRLVYNIIFVSGHALVLGRAIYYILYGVKKRPGIDRAIITLIMLFIFSGILLFEGSKLVLQILSGIYVFIILYLIVMIITKRNNGDNLLRDEEEIYIDDKYFDHVEDLIYQVKVSFPLDIENYQYDRKNGKIERICLIKEGKYAGRCGAVIKADGKYYLCRIDQVKLYAGVNEVLAEKEDVIVVKSCISDDGKSDILVI
jgi:hypothetical protein